MAPSAVYVDINALCPSAMPEGANLVSNVVLVFLIEHMDKVGVGKL